MLPLQLHGDINGFSISHFVLKNPLCKIGKPKFIKSIGPLYDKPDCSDFDGSNIIFSISHITPFL